jgi:catechol 2,3-dioxygenase-like lactoylglutathione lyase family enzyme
MSHLGLVTVVVRDYDEAIAFYVDKLGFELVEDTPRGVGKRWVVVAPPGSREAAVLLARAAGGAQEDRVGDQTGGRVGWILNTESFERDYERMRAAGVAFEEEPRHETYGMVAVFRDLYGNRWDLLELYGPDDAASAVGAESAVGAVGAESAGGGV